jgi:protein-tyrosine phosphatase
VRALKRTSLDLSQHESRQVTPAMLANASLVIGLERRHVREMVVMLPAAWPRTFTLKELVRRGTQVGPRRANETAEEWIERVHVGRQRDELIGADERDDVLDPMGSSAADFERTADELDELLARLVDLLAGEPDLPPMSL